MALDGMLLHLVADEIKEAVLDSKVDKIYQPEKDALIITFRARGGNYKLLISASSANARIHFTSASPENPPSPPMFCMLLRKHLVSGRLTDIRQNELERCICFYFECYNDFGDKVIRTLVCEIMGKYSNIVLVDENGKITDCIKRIDFADSSVRQLLPGLKYTQPPQQNKLNPLSSSADELFNKTVENAELHADKAVLNTIQGYSPIVCREIVCRATLGQTDTPINEFTQSQLDRLRYFLTHIADSPIPVLVADPKDNRPFDFSFIDITQYGSKYVTKKCSSFSELLEIAFAERASADLRRRKQQDILKILSSTADRINRRLCAQKNELADCQKRELYKKRGDLISANIYRLQKGETTLEADDWETGEKVQIPLDNTLSPSQNAQYWYKKYRKACTAESMLTRQISEGEQELIYIDSVFDELTRADSSSALSEIKAELTAIGYIRMLSAEKRKKLPMSAPDTFISSDEIKIMCGKNNTQNDELTLRTAHGGYIWLHTKNIPGCHTVIFENADNIPERTLVEAAILAATFSKAAESSNVPVDYTLAKYVKKPSGAKPGMVIYTNQKTLYVSPDKALAEKLKKE